MRDLLSDLNNYVWPSKWQYASETVNDVNATCGIISPQQAVNSMSKRFLDGDLCQNIFYFHNNLFFGFQTRFYQMRWFYTYRSFKHSKWWRHKLDDTYNI